MNVKNQRRLASQLLKCGVNRVWIDPEMIEDVSDAVTRADVRNLINQGIIKKEKKRGISKSRINRRIAQKGKGRRKGQGSHKGKIGATNPKKRKWIERIRSIRNYLKELRKEGKIDPTNYRIYYKRADGGEFKNLSHLKTHLMMDGIIKNEKEENAI
jgi:large subunit ribosomal protein L19e